MRALKYDMTGWKMWEHGVPDSKIEVISKGSSTNLWVCKCHLCGTIKEINGYHLRKGMVKTCGEHRIHNTYDLSGEYGICYTAKGTPFYFDLEDYDLIKDYAWYERLGYAVCKQESVFFSMQDLVFPHSEEFVVDHIYGNRNDNRKAFLRLATRTQNNQNKRLRSDNTSGVTGVNYHKKRNSWVARIRVNKQEIRLGYFVTFESAVRARLQAEKEYFGEFAPQKNLFEKYNIN